MTAKRKRMTREERRQSLLRAAERVFADKGYRLTSIDDIVEAPLVVACDGALSLLAKEAGLHKGFKP